MLLLAFALLEQALETRLIRFVLEQRLSTLHRPRETHFQFDKREWFAEKIEGARAHCSNGAGRVGISRKEDRNDRAVHAGKSFDQFKTADFRHAQIAVHETVRRGIALNLF